MPPTAEDSPVPQRIKGHTVMAAIALPALSRHLRRRYVAVTPTPGPDYLVAVVVYAEADEPVEVATYAITGTYPEAVRTMIRYADSQL